MTSASGLARRARRMTFRHFRSASLVTEHVLMTVTSATSPKGTTEYRRSMNSRSSVLVSAKFSLQPSVWNETRGIAKGLLSADVAAVQRSLAGGSFSVRSDAWALSRSTITTRSTSIRVRKRRLHPDRHRGHPCRRPRARRISAFDLLENPISGAGRRHSGLHALLLSRSAPHPTRRGSGRAPHPRTGRWEGYRGG